MSEKSNDIRSVKCTACGGDFGKSLRVEGSGEDAEEVPIAKCLSCGREYDRRTEEYYHVYADMFTVANDSTAFRLGLKGEIDGVEYEIIGRVRYQDQEEWELDIWDEWLAVTAEGTYHWFVEEGGHVHAYEEYVPASIDLEASPSVFEFEGKRYSKDTTGFVARMVYAEGELTWKPVTGEAVQCYDFSAKGYLYTIEQTEDEVSVSRGKRVPYKKIIQAFLGDEYRQLYENTMSRRFNYRRKAMAYGVMCCVSFLMIMWGCFSGRELPGGIDALNPVMLAANQPKTEEGGTVYYSQVLFTAPVELNRKDTLYRINVRVDESVQNLSREWMSYRLMLIRENKYRELFSDLDAGAKSDALEDIDISPEPVESLSVGGDFWHEDGYDSDGYWQESETRIRNSFLLDEPGKYHLYLELYSQNPRNPAAMRITIEEGVRSYRYYVIALVLFVILWTINLFKSRTYNELDFDIASD